ncbi:hypothetical protein NIES2107_69610 (plasmid) [Nostoc carneum NIES-2107]|nr:hypothetical protein NIES2107_69610 [Nostoc carneum NIES-2107]
MGNGEWGMGTGDWGLGIGKGGRGKGEWGLGKSGFLHYELRIADWYYWLTCKDALDNCE